MNNIKIQSNQSNSEKLSVMDEVQILPSLTKSANDVKDYKTIQLANGLKALLISDTSYDLEKLKAEENDSSLINTGLKISAASLCIGKMFYSYV